MIHLEHTIRQNVAGRTRPYNEGKEDAAAIQAKRPPNVLTSFFKTSCANEKAPTESHEVKKKCDYSKYRHVCLLCAKSEKKKVREASILSRGASFQVEGHLNGNHKLLLTNEMTLRVVPIDHSSVPINVMDLAIS